MVQFISTIVRTFGAANHRHHEIMESRVLKPRLGGHDSIQSWQFNWRRECRRCRIQREEGSDSQWWEERWKGGGETGEERGVREMLPRVSLPALSATASLVTTSRTFVRLSKSRGELTNLGPDAWCICILCGIIPRLIIGDSIAEHSVRLSVTIMPAVK